jgi:hypothetical protein
MFLLINLGEVEDKRFELSEPSGRVFKAPGTSLRLIKNPPYGATLYAVIDIASRKNVFPDVQAKYSLSIISSIDRI